MPEVEEGKNVVNGDVQNSLPVRPSVDDAKATAQTIKDMGGGIRSGPAVPVKNKGGRPRKDGLPPGSGPSSAPRLPDPPPFNWTKENVSLLANAPFNVAYAYGGPDHEHWKKAKDTITASGCYENAAFCFNQLGLKNPIYLILALSIMEYGGAVSQCAFVSFKIWKDKQEQAKTKEKKNPEAPK